MLHRCSYYIATLLLITSPALAADQHKAQPSKPQTDVAPWEQPQPAQENIDYAMYGRIREEGLQHSHIMEYASALADDIGPRLTGSPNLANIQTGNSTI